MRCRPLSADISACLLVFLGLLALGPVRSEPLDDLQLLRESGCGGLLPAASSLQRQEVLDRISERWARGLTLAAAGAGEGVDASRMTALRVHAPSGSLLAPLRQVNCGNLARPLLQAVGLYRHGADIWIVLVPSVREHAATQITPRAISPTQEPAPLLAARALQLINEVRLRGAQCGNRWFAPVPEVSLSRTLGGVAFGHATDMADHGYFEHADMAGHSPADRVRAAGYREKLVGENIAYGPTSVEEVVQGWLDSPGHCENIMDRRFSQMGIAAANGRISRHGLYWVQLLAAPRA